MRSWLVCVCSGLPLIAAADPDTASDLILAPVIVEVQKRSESTKEVPIGMTVLNAQALENTHARTLDEMQALVPNFSMNRVNGDSTINIRGVGGGGRNIGFDPRVGVYLDGVYIGQSQALLLPLLEVADVEVLRGPQGYLFGRNTDAGAVNITSTLPSAKLESYFKSTVASYQNFKQQGSVSGPISASAQGRFSISNETRAGFSKNLYTQNTLDGFQRFATRAQLSIQPNEKLNLDVSADYANISQNSVLEETTTAMFGLPLSSGRLPDYRTQSDGDQHLTNRLAGLQLNAQYSLDNGNTLTAITAVRGTYQERQADDDFTTADLLDLYFRDRFKQTSQEIRIASPSDQQWRYVAGVYFLNEKADSYRSATLGVDGTSLVRFPGLAAPVAFNSLFGISAGALVPVAGKVNTHSYAAFGAMDYALGPFATLNVGARLTLERKQLQYQLDGSQSGNFGIATVPDYQDSLGEHDVSPTLGMTFKLTPQHNVYMKYASGFKSGGWNVDFLTASQLTNGFRFNKETVDSYEIGLKGNSANQRLQYDAALFLSRYHDYQVFQLVKVGSANELQLRNAAEAVSKGFEGSVTALLTDRLKVGTSLGLLSAQYTHFPNGLSVGEDAAGRPLSDASKVSTALTLQYSVEVPSLAGNLTLYAEESYRSKAYSGLDRDPDTFVVPSRHLTNARVAYQHAQKHLELSLYATNLFNEHYVNFHGRDFLGAGVIRHGDPHVVGLEGRYTF